MSNDGKLAVDDKREMVANFFDRSATMFEVRGELIPGPGGAALVMGSNIAAVIAGLIRAFGVDDVKEAIDVLAHRKSEGVITDAHVARDDKTITDAVSSLFDDGEDNDGK